MRRDLLVAAFSVAAVGIAIPAGAQAPTPVGTECTAASPTVTFGGTGITPAAAFCATSAAGVELILSATPRGPSGMPPVTETAPGVFAASTGGTLVPDRSLWNFDYAIINAGASPTDVFTLLVDHNPTNATSDLIFTPIGTPGLGSQNSENLGFASIGGGSFNPNANGVYTFELDDRLASGALVDNVLINVVVGTGAPVTATPEPASLALVATGLIGLGGIVRRRNKRNAAE